MAIRTTYTKIWPYLAELDGFAEPGQPLARSWRLPEGDALFAACDREARLRAERERVRAHAK